MASIHVLSYTGVFAFYWVWLRLDEELKCGMGDFLHLFVILLGVLSVVVVVVMIVVADVMIELSNLVLVVVAVMTDLVES